MPFGDPQFLQQMQALGLSSMSGLGGSNGIGRSPAPVFGQIMGAAPAQAQGTAPMPDLGTTPTLGPVMDAASAPTAPRPPLHPSFQVPPLHPFRPSSTAPAALPYASYGGPEQTYFTGNTLQNFGWAGPINTANQAAGTAAPAPAPVTPVVNPATVVSPDPVSGAGGGGMKAGGRTTRKRPLGALNALAKMGRI